MDLTFKDEKISVVQALAPASDLFNTDPGGDVVRGDQHEELYVLLSIVATTGTAVITVEACDDVTPTNTTAIAFKRSVVGTPGTETDVAAAGFTTATSATSHYLIRIDPANLPAGKPYFRIKAAEGVDAAVIGQALYIFAKPKYANPVSLIA